MQPLRWIGARQPLTPRGVAALARAPLKRLLLAQFLFALLLAGVSVWFLHAAWFPTVGEAIGHLPAHGAILRGRLMEPVGDPPYPLAGGQFIAFAIDPSHTASIRAPAYLQVEFGRRDVRFVSLLGYLDVRYPAGDWSVAFNRGELEPWWGAWGPPILGITFGVVAIAAILGWALFAGISFWAAWLVALFADRSLTLWESWKLAGAASLPGTLLLAAALFCHGLGLLDLVQFAAVAAAYFGVGGIYVLVSPLFAPKVVGEAQRKNNPFVS